MHFYSIHVIAEYNLSGSEIICRQITTVEHHFNEQLPGTDCKWNHPIAFML